MTGLFSDREQGPKPLTETTIDPRTWRGIEALVHVRVADGSLGYRFPKLCPDGAGTIGTDESLWSVHVAAHEHEISDTRGYDEAPRTLSVLDFLEIVARSIGQPTQRGYHGYFQHHHLAFDRQAGLAHFVDDINLLLSRNRLTFMMEPDGRMRRVGPPVLRDAIVSGALHTGDHDTDTLLALAQERIFSPKPQDQIDALEKLWDAFERIKTLRPGVNKAAQVQALLDHAAEGTGPRFREALEAEARALTDIGNKFRIRHSETDKEPLSRSGQVDALFHRMWSFIAYIIGTMA